MCRMDFWRAQVRFQTVLRGSVSVSGKRTVFQDQFLGWTEVFSFGQEWIGQMDAFQWTVVVCCKQFQSCLWALFSQYCCELGQCLVSENSDLWSSALFLESSQQVMMSFSHTECVLLSCS